MRVIFTLFKSYVKYLVDLMGYEIISKHQSIGFLEKDLNISMITVKNLGFQPKLIVDAGHTEPPGQLLSKKYSGMLIIS